MAIAPRLELRQTQALVMTPQLQQAIKLLQLSNIELTAYVEQELERNPLLEPADGEPGSAEGVPDAEGEEPTAPPPESETLDAVNFDTPDVLPTGETSALDVDYDNLYNNDAAAESGANDGGGDSARWELRGGGGRGFDEDRPGLEQTLSEDITLRDHLYGQLGVDILDPVDRLIGAQLIDLVDEAGYLTGDLAQVAETLGCELAQVEAVLARLQRFDPPGIFARNLAECLALQLRDKDRLDPAMQALLANLDLVARRDIDKLTKRCGVDAEDVADMIAEIRALNPKPALAFDHAVAQPVTPDVLMRPASGGGWIVELNNDTLPRVLVNNAYYTRVVKEARGKDDKTYLSECFQTANWLVKALHQRATTILKVASEIVLQQDAFFARGVRFLKPLVLRDIAQAIEMHESTVSRVTSNKFIATPRGIYELKYFFTTAIQSSTGGDSHSAEAVRHRIKSLIDNESPAKVLSDDQIVDILVKDGIDIARRTVAKYREALHIPSSVRRRREKYLSR